MTDSLVSLRQLTTAFTLAALAATAAPALAADAAQPISTAAQHAGYAAGADDIKGIHTHLQHVLNCLVGPDGEGFDDSAADPCKGQSAMAAASMDSQTMKLENAADLARTGLEIEAPEPAKHVALAIQTVLKGALTE